MRKEEIYKSIKTVGFVSFIPFILAAGPLSGYFAGSFLQKKFGFSYGWVFLGVALGFLAAIMEVVKILKAIARVSKK